MKWKSEKKIYLIIMVILVLVGVVYLSLYLYNWFTCPLEVVVNYDCEELEEILTLDLYDNEKIFWKDCEGNLKPYEHGTPFWRDRLEKKYKESCLK